jgi:hypothetical protein
LVPLILGQSRLFTKDRMKWIFVCFFLFISSLIFWNKNAYDFEFKGENSLWDIQKGCFLFFLAGIVIEYIFVFNHEP